MLKMFIIKLLIESLLVVLFIDFLFVLLYISRMKNEEELVKYYNKFNEDKRLNTRHGIVEFKTSTKYIDMYLRNFRDPKILDVGAGTGKYSIYYFDRGFDVTAVEMVKHNLRVIQSKSRVKSFLGNALDLSMFDDDYFDIVLLFGPMYHLISHEDKLRALLNAKRVLRNGGLIFISYCLCDFAIIKHGFIDNNILNELDCIDDDFNIISKDKDLYSFVRLEEINELMKEAGLKRKKILSQDGPTEYMRGVINKMDNETFDLFLDYHLKTCERKELLGSGRHILDILEKGE